MIPVSQLILAAPLPSEATGAMPLPLDPALLPAGVLLITGAFMLLAGRRLLRAGLGITGALAGGLIGNAIGLASASVLPPLVWTVLGGLLGLALGLLLWRVTVASIMAGSSATLAVLAVLFAVQTGLLEPMPMPIDSAQVEVPASALDTLRTVPTGQFAPPPPPPSLEESLASAAAETAQEHARNWWGEALGNANTLASTWLGAVNARLANTFTRVWASWERLDSGVRAALSGVALLGGLFGFLFGLVAGKWSGSIVAVVAGAGLVLLGALIALEILLPRPEGLFGGIHPAFWLVGWAGLAGVGSLIQWHAERRRADIEGTLET